MLLVGSRGAGGFAALALGSVSRYVATHASVPVVVARRESMASRREIVVGIRDPGESATALEFAFAEAALRKARLLAMHAWFWFAPAFLPPGALGEMPKTPVDPRALSAEAGERPDAALGCWREKYPDVQTDWDAHGPVACVEATP